jgi:putative NADPH-quinone reductase
MRAIAGLESSVPDAGRFDLQAEQRHASASASLPRAVMDEIASIDRADVLVLHYPMWWHLPPAILKGWFDRVFAYGEVYASQRRFEKGRYAGKRAMLSITVGTSRETYMYGGRSGDIDLMLWPINFTLAYVGYDVLAPFVAYGVEGGLRYSDQSTIDARLQDIAHDFRNQLAKLDQRQKVSFNRMAEWGLMAGLSQTPRSIRHLFAAARISNWNKNSLPHRIMACPARNRLATLDNRFTGNLPAAPFTRTSGPTELYRGLGPRPFRRS